MFDISFSELIVVGIVALVVIGPERMPKVARTVGLLLGRMQRYVSTVKADIHREMQLDELKKLQAEMQASAHHVESSIRNGMLTVEDSVAQATQSTQSVIDDLSVKAKDESQEASARDAADSGKTGERK